MKTYETIDTRRSVRELLPSFLPYAALFAAMCLAYHCGLPYGIILVMSVPAAGFLLRIFIILHDCGHYSFSNEPNLNSIFGYICGVFTFSSFPDFRRSHALHHATVANLDTRGVGDVPTMTLHSGGHPLALVGPARRQWHVDSPRVVPRYSGARVFFRDANIQK